MTDVFEGRKDREEKETMGSEMRTIERRLRGHGKPKGTKREWKSTERGKWKIIENVLERLAVQYTFCGLGGSHFLEQSRPGGWSPLERHSHDLVQVEVKLKFDQVS